jgi:phosphoglycerol transferase
VPAGREGKILLPVTKQQGSASGDGMLDTLITKSAIATDSGISKSGLKLFVVAQYLTALLATLLLLGFGSIKPFSMLALGGDNISTMVFAKNYIDGNGFRINPNLAFPGTQDNAFFPSFDFSYRLFMRLTAKIIHDPVAIYYLMYVFGVTAMFASCAYALRTLGFRHWLCAFAAVVWVVTPWFTFRSLVHDFLALCFTVPLGAALAIRIWLHPELNLWRQGGLVGIVISLLMIATSGLYYAYFSLMFIAFAGVVAAASGQSLRPLLSVLLCSAIIVPVLLLTGFGSALPAVLSGDITPVKRIPEQQLIFGLNFAEATHLLNNIPGLEWVNREYKDFGRYLATEKNLENWPGLALTLVIFASPLIVAVGAFAKGERSYWRSLILASALCLVFGIIYSMSGGLAYYVNLFINASIRATDRIIPFLSFFALVALLAFTENVNRPVFRFFTSSAVIAALVISIYPAVATNLRWRQQMIMSSPQMSNNLRSIQNVLDAKNKASLRAILQIPHIEWPETGLMRGYDSLSFQDYFVLDTAHSGTKWSYGSTRQQASFSTVEAILKGNEQAGLADAAGKIGFDGAIVEKQPVEQATWQMWDRNLSNGGCKLFEDEKRILFALHPC